MVNYVAYPKAMRLLADRLEATPEELAAWVWMGPKINGLAAYLNANELDPPPRFYYDDAFCSKDADYISPLMACWFNTDDIFNFKPVDRYITGIALIERWNSQPGIQPKAFIQAKIEESRLNDHHPIYGGTKGSSPEGDFPPLESGLFLLSEIELIEKAELDPSLVRLSEQYPALEENTFESQKNNPLLCFQEMDKLRFNEIKILIDPDNLVLRISARDRKCTAPFAARGTALDSQEPGPFPDNNMPVNSGNNLLKVDAPQNTVPEILPEPEIKRPGFHTHDDWFQLEGNKYPSELYWHSWTKPKGEQLPEPVNEWISTPIHTIAITSNEQNESFGLILRFVNPNGDWREWAAPMHLFKGSAEELRGELLNMGGSY